MPCVHEAKAGACHEFEAGLCYRVLSRPAGLQEESLTQENKRKQNKGWGGGADSSVQSLLTVCPLCED